MPTSMDRSHGLRKPWRASTPDEKHTSAASGSALLGHVQERHRPPPELFSLY